MRARRFVTSSGLWLLGLIAAGTLSSSCTSSEGNGTGMSAGSPASDHSATAGGSGATPGVGGSLNIGGTLAEAAAGGAPAEPTAVSKDDACATSTEPTSALPSVLQLVVDTSGSMDWPPGWAPKTPDDSKPPGATKWEITRDALAEAVAALPADTALGASFFPNVEQEGSTCLLDHEASPIELLGKKGSNARAAWEAALADVVPVGATPTHGAYRFGLSQLESSPLPGNKFVLLITDGTPTCTLKCECTEGNLPVDSQPLIAEVAAALKDGVRTFVIGSPGSEEVRDVLSQIASAGGTAKQGCSDSGPSYCHFDMTREPDLASGLAQALDQIAIDLRSCEYPIPTPPSGEKLDPNLVNVLYTPKPGAESITIARDASASDCSDGWQYSSDGRSIVLCGATCTRTQTEKTGSVEILFGCRTVVMKPK